MERRDFIKLSAISGLGMSLFPMMSCGSQGQGDVHSEEYYNLCYELLKDWCDGMIKVQTIAPDDLSIHGSLDCPSCDHIHGRCMDAVYPFMYMADKTGDKKYMDAAILVMGWAENNVSQEDGSWTVIPNPKSWRGISVFGAIALAEALKYHGQILDEATHKQWTERLGRVAEYLFNNFTISFTNINYGATAVYGLNLIGRVLNNNKYLQKSHQLAEGAKAYFTENESLLFGEIKPTSDKLSAKGLRGVDLGYNVEESLNSLAMYALLEKDEELLTILSKSLDSHLQFMLPDGAWDNSWGTRQYKWSYWGSRTCDGSQPAYAMMAKYNGAFATAAIKNTELLQYCTDKGLLHGGPHFVSHGVKPCVHHTFAHAKPLAALLDHWDKLPQLTTQKALPRATADGINYFKDLDVALFARGPWRGTVSAYDAEYHYKYDFRQATGAALSMLYHKKVGTLLAASMAVYKLVEVNNQQAASGEDIALTPRIETYKDKVWYTNLYDLTASFDTKDNKSKLDISAHVKLKNEDRQIVQDSASDFQLDYTCNNQEVTIIASTEQELSLSTSFVLPLVSKHSEEVKQLADNKITIAKPEGLVTVQANVPLKVKEMTQTRTFNQVPGLEALPIVAFFDKNTKQVEITISVS